MKGADIGDMLSNVGTAPAAGAGPAAAATGGDAPAKEDKKEGKQQLLSHSETNNLRIHTMILTRFFVF